MSKLVRRGIFRKLRPESPKVRPRGNANAQGLKSKGPVPPSAAAQAADGVAWGSPTTSANIETPPPVPLLTEPFETPALLEKPLYFTLNGIPVWMVVMPENCQ